jgi:ankyrin repeat protein
MQRPLDGWTPLHEAAQSGDAARISRLLQARLLHPRRRLLQQQTTQTYYLTPVIPSISYLISAPLTDPGLLWQRDPELALSQDVHGGTPLHTAAYNGRFYAARKLLEVLPPHLLSTSSTIHSDP